MTTEATPGAATVATRRARRHAFADYLYGLHRGLSAPTPAHAAECRRILAILRRGFAGSRQEFDAYGIVLAQNPPPDEQEVWLLLASLFAIHPQSPRPSARSLGSSMRKLADGRGPSIERRFQQLLSVDRNALPHYLRQTMQLLKADEVPVDYRRLIDDLVVLLDRPGRTENEALRIRLRWAREYHWQRTTNPHVAEDGGNEADTIHSPDRTPTDPEDAS